MNAINPGHTYPTWPNIQAYCDERGGERSGEADPARPILASTIGPTPTTTARRRSTVGGFQWWRTLATFTQSTVSAVRCCCWASWPRPRPASRRPAKANGSRIRPSTALQTGFLMAGQKAAGWDATSAGSRSASPSNRGRCDDDDETQARYFPPIGRLRPVRDAGPAGVNVPVFQVRRTLPRRLHDSPQGGRGRRWGTPATKIRPRCGGVGIAT